MWGLCEAKKATRWLVPSGAAPGSDPGEACNLFQVISIELENIFSALANNYTVDPSFCLSSSL